MTAEQKQAYEWAKNQTFQSVAARVDELTTALRASQEAEKNEPRLIDANALLWKAIEEKRFVLHTEDLIRRDVIIQTAHQDLADFIDSVPTVDAVPVVHCGECARRYTELCALYAGKMNGKDYFIQQCDDFFCNKGQRLNDVIDEVGRCDSVYIPTEEVTNGLDQH